MTNSPTRKLTKAKSTVQPRVTAELTSIRSSYVTAKSPGEISGAAVVFTVTVTNGTAKPVDLSNVVVNVTGANGDPAGQITSAPAQPLPHHAGTGKSVSGTYVFTVPKSQRNPVTVSVTLSADTSVALFRGKV